MQVESNRRLNLSIGITYAVRHLKLAFIASKWIYRATWVPDGGGDKHEERREKIENLLKGSKAYTIIGAGTQISGSALGYIYRTDNLTDHLMHPSLDGRGEWKGTRSLISKFLDDMERDLKQAIPISTSDQLAPKAGFTEWKWDTSREQWYYWCTTDRTFKYQSGMWIRLDGSMTTAVEEIELAKALGVVPVGVSSRSQNDILSVITPMQQLTMGQGEDGSG